MAGLIKNQILKHLSKFTKNLSPDKISLSAMKGEGDLSNLELDEVVLTDLLALPGWIRLKRATCNKVTIKIQWTKLNSQPICLYLDEVTVETETCDVPRTPTSSTPVSSYNKGGKYGFAEQIIDGICLSINSVIVNFRSNKFNASIQVARILVQSKTPKWQDGDLFVTRLKNDLVGEVMIFKEAEWQTLRIEANALDTGDPLLATTPLRLIANQSKIRITIKKKISDCSIVSSRLQVNLDDLLWVLTDSQLSAAMSFATALSDIIAKSKETMPSPQNTEDSSKGPSSSSSSTSIPTSHHSPTSPQHPLPSSARQASAPHKVGTKTQQNKAKIFEAYNITETSYHLYTGRIDLHLCDDVSPEESLYQRKVEGGAIQFVLYHLELDIYPYHRAGEARVRWPKYDENMKLRDTWASELLKVFKEDVRTVREVFRASECPPTDGVILRPNINPKGSQLTHVKDGKGFLKPQQIDLLESCIVVRVEDFALYRVSTALDSKRSTPKKFLSSDKKQLLLPPEMPSVHVVFTEYYFPDGRDFPVPHSNLFIVVNPICLAVDYLTLLWMNMFSLNLAKKVAEIPQKPGSKLHVDIRLDALMPRVVLPQTDTIGMHARTGDLDGLQLQLSKAVITNCRLPNSRASRTDLKSMIQSFDSSHLFGRDAKTFPNQQDDCIAIPKRFYDHILRIDDGYPDPNVEKILRKRDMTSGQSSDDFVRSSAQNANPSSYHDMIMNSFRLNMEKDVWCIVVDQVWLEFTIVKNSLARSRTLPLMESFPLSIWLYQFPPVSEVDSPAGSNLPSPVASEFKSVSPENDSLNADACVLMKIDVKVQLQIDHERYSFLMNLMETISRCSEEMEADYKNITGKTVTPKRSVLSVIVKEVEVALLFPPCRDLSSQLTSPDDGGISSGILSDAFQENQLALPGDGVLDPNLKPEMSETISIPSVNLSSELESEDPSLCSYLVEFGNDALNLLDEGPEARIQLSNGTASISLSGSRSQSPDPNLNNGVSGNKTMTRDSSFPGLKKTDIKKTFQAFTNLTSKLNVQRNSSRRGTSSNRTDDSVSDSLDSLSITSGSLSDEDDEFAWERIVNEAECPAFERKGMNQDENSVVEVESEDTSSSFTATLSKKVVTVFTVRIGGIEAVAHSFGKELTAKAIVENFSMAEGGNMEMEKFMQSFTSGSRDFTKWIQKPAGALPLVQARFDLGEKAERVAAGAGERGFVQALVDGIKVKLMASTLKGIGELFEDDKPSPPDFLMNATLSNVAVTFVDDKLPMYLPEPKNSVIDLVLDKAVITRGKDGVFHMGASSQASPLAESKTESKSESKIESKLESNIDDKSESTPSSAVDLLDDYDILKGPTSDKSTEMDSKLTGRTSLESENDVLRRQLEKIGKMSCCRKECSDIRTQLETMEKVKTENTELKRELEIQMGEILAMKQEREALLNVVQKLQDDLSYSERMRNRSSFST